jgi:hypothetical protein
VVEALFQQQLRLFNLLCSLAGYAEESLGEGWAELKTLLFRGGRVAARGLQKKDIGYNACRWVELGMCKRVGVQMCALDSTQSE